MGEQKPLGKTPLAGQPQFQEDLPTRLLVYFMPFFVKMHWVANLLLAACSDSRSLPYGGY